METACFCSSVPPSTSFSTSTSLPQRKKIGLFSSRTSKGRVFAAGRESYEQDYQGGRLVDESMIVLKKRIHEMKVVERNYEPPADWTEWEKQHYAFYDEIICNFVGLVQLQLMNTRPSLALGMLALVSMSVPASTLMIISHLMEAANGVLSTAHLN